MTTAHEELIRVETDGDLAVARFTRRTILDPMAIEAIGARLMACVDAGARRLVISFAKVESATSAMIGKLVSLYSAIDEAGGTLVFCEVDPFLRQIFAICRLPPEVRIVATEAEARQA